MNVTDILDQWCPSNAMSAHHIAGQPARRKTGGPGKWHIVQGHLTLKEELDQLMQQLLADKQTIVEQHKDGIIIAQHDIFRLVYTTPPLSSTDELTITRMLRSPNLNNYNLPQLLTDRLKRKHGVLIAGAPGQGKSTFVSALIDSQSDSAIIKTVESPRDLKVPANVTQLSQSSDDNMIRDTLLLSRPDIVCIDEVRHKTDAQLFADLRLCGIGCFGVIHASKPVDAIARYVNHTGIGEVAHTLDTVVFINEGKVAQALDISLDMKVPSGIKAKDMARPVIIVRDLLTQETLYEIFSFADQTIIHTPKQEEQLDLRTKYVQQILSKHNIVGEVSKEGNLIHVHTTKDFAAVLEPHIKSIEQEIETTIHIHAQKQSQPITFTPFISQQSIGLRINTENNCTVYIENEYLLCGKPSKKGIMSIKLESEQAKKFIDALKTGKSITVVENI